MQSLSLVIGMMVEACILYLDIGLNKKYWCKRHFLPRQIKIKTYSNFAPIYGLSFFLFHLSNINRFLLFVKRLLTF